MRHSPAEFLMHVLPPRPIVMHNLPHRPLVLHAAQYLHQLQR